MATLHKIKEKHKTKNISEDSIPSFIRKTFEILEVTNFFTTWLVFYNSPRRDNIQLLFTGVKMELPLLLTIPQSSPTKYFLCTLSTITLPLLFDKYSKFSDLFLIYFKLNMYDFHKKRSLNMDHVYYHELFQRGKKYHNYIFDNLLIQIKDIYWKISKGRIVKTQQIVRKAFLLWNLIKPDKI